MAFGQMKPGAKISLVALGALAALVILTMSLRGTLTRPFIFPAPNYRFTPALPGGTMLSVRGERTAYGYYAKAGQRLVEDLGEILFDCLILPGGGKGAENMHKSAWVNDAILRHWKNDRIVAAICASPAVVLLPTGILANKHATCFPGLERRFTQDVKAVDSDVCVDGKLVTSKGPGTAMAFSLRLVELLCGLSKAIDVGRRMVVPRM